MIDISSIDIFIYWLLASFITLELLIIVERLDDNPIEDWYDWDWEDNLVMTALFPVGFIAIIYKIFKLLIPTLKKLARIEL